MNPWTTGKTEMRRALVLGEAIKVDDQDSWRIPYLRSLLELKYIQYYDGNQEEEKNVAELINSLVTN